MNKHQEALDKIRHITENACNCPDPFTYSETTEIIKQCNTLQELIDKVSLIQKALLEGIETIEFGVIDKPHYISLKKDWHKDSSIHLNVYVKEQGMAFGYSLDSYGTLWKLKDDEWKVEYGKED